MFRQSATELPVGTGVVDLVDLRVCALGERFDVLMAQLIGIDADLGQDVLPRGIERFRLSDDRAFGRRPSWPWCWRNGRFRGLGRLLRRGFGLGCLFGRSDGNLRQRGLAARALHCGLDRECA